LPKGLQSQISCRRIYQWFQLKQADDTNISSTHRRTRTGSSLVSKPSNTQARSAWVCYSLCHRCKQADETMIHYNDGGMALEDDANIISMRKIPSISYL